MVEDGAVATYRDLANLMTAGMRERNRPSVKTYLVERDPDADTPSEDWLRRTLRTASPRRQLAITRLAGAPHIFRARVGRGVTLWIDTGDRQFWEVHSLDDTPTVNGLVGRWASSTPALQLPWLPQELMRRVATAGEFVGFGLSFSREYFAEDPEDAETLSVRVSGSDSRSALTELQGQKTFLRTSALSMVRLRQPLAGPGAMERGHLTATLTARGRVSTRGDDFERHRTFFRSVSDLYHRTCSAVTTNLSVGAVDDAGEGLRGGILVDLVSPLDDLGGFCGRVFSGTEPFLLWGFLERRSSDFIVAHAFDRAAGRAFSVEATPKQWRIYLPAGASGQVVLRLLALLQHHHDQRVRIPALNELLG